MYKIRRRKKYCFMILLLIKNTKFCKMMSDETSFFLQEKMISLRIILGFLVNSTSNIPRERKIGFAFFNNVLYFFIDFCKCGGFEGIGLCFFMLGI